MTTWSDLYPLHGHGQYININAVSAAEKAILLSESGDTPRLCSDNDKLLIVASLNVSKIATIAALGHRYVPRKLNELESATELSSAHPFPVPET